MKVEIENYNSFYELTLVFSPKRRFRRFRRLFLTMFSKEGPSYAHVLVQGKKSSASKTDQSPSKAVQSPVKTDKTPVQTDKAPIKTDESPSKLPRRPGYGRSGVPCKVRANLLCTQLQKEVKMYFYEVKFSPEIWSKKWSTKVILQLYVDSKHLLNQHKLAYDGKSCVYTSKRLPFESEDFDVKLTGTNGGKEWLMEYKVSFKFIREVDITSLNQFIEKSRTDYPQEAIKALNVVLQTPPLATYELVGDSFFDRSLGDPRSLTEGLELWVGYFQSLRPRQMGLSLNINSLARPFYQTIDVYEFVAKNLEVRDLSGYIMSDKDRIKAICLLKDLMVEMLHEGRVVRYKVYALSDQPAVELMVSHDPEGEISLFDRYSKLYPTQMKYPNLPAIQIRKSTPEYIPMELFKIAPGQRYRSTLNAKQVSGMRKANCQKPADKEKIIKKVVKSNIYDAENMPSQKDNADETMIDKMMLMMNEFGISVQNGLTTIDAHVLSTPQLTYNLESGKQIQVLPEDGHWNMIDKKMIDGGSVTSWTCVSFSRTKLSSQPEEFCKSLIRMCRCLGMKFNKDPLVPIRSADAGQIEETLVGIVEESGKTPLQLLIVILPKDSGYYGEIKTICETRLGLVSQCCQSKKAFSKDTEFIERYLEYLALKINVKVGGRNFVLQHAILALTAVPTIVFGSDVSHPSPGDVCSPSIAAVVASMDWPELTKYRSVVSAQSSRQEIIMDLYKEDTNDGKTVGAGMIRELLLAFKESTGICPQRIIFYRDGVGESQFSEVLEKEVAAIRMACKSLGETYKPRLTFVVVQKRHQTRLFPADDKLIPKSGNILPGTVVDTKICHPMEFDFYLCSHGSMEGTSHPAHYHVLCDDNGFDAETIQDLTYNLCYRDARCTSSLAIVAPAYYAHLAAGRARYYVDKAGIMSLPKIKKQSEIMYYC
ncbi:protein argonaute 5-like isoform X1 [Nicotiana tomentosiformis]|uniref:protein argonaute 5-like isoform X1 n=1 Tax=Nicotiana tomentosiformis TaxID=4098 RepID=UPI00388C7022